MELIGLYTVHKNEKSGNKQSYPVHRHTSYEILMLIRGDCGFVISDTEYELRPGDTVLILENETHGLLTEGGPVEFLTVQFIPRAFEEAGLSAMLEKLVKIFGLKSGAAFTLDDHIKAVVNAALRRICDERSDTDIGMYFTYIRSVLYEIARNGTVKKGVSVKKKSPAEEKVQIYNAVTDYIGANLDNISDLSFIKNVFHYSNSYINKLFRYFLGIPVWQYITVKRLDLARNLIAEGGSAKNAALRCGFNDYSVFYKSFVKHFGLSPSAVRRRR